MKLKSTVIAPPVHPAWNAIATPMRPDAAGIHDSTPPAGRGCTNTMLAM
jgi:hypothetical protein